jgi:hypothetical protein
VTATVSSDPAASQPDGTHRLFLTFDTALCYHFDSSYRGSHITSNEEGDVSLKYRIVLIVNTGEDGRWVFTQGDSVLPEIINNQVNLRKEKADGRLGSFAWVGSSTVSSGNGGDMPNMSWSNAVNHLPDLQSLTDGSIQNLMSTLNKAMPTLNDTLLMPAGDVYTFNGLDSTEEGHVLTRVKYRTRTAGGRV